MWFGDLTAKHINHREYIFIWCGMQCQVQMRTAKEATSKCSNFELLLNSFVIPNYLCVIRLLQSHKIPRICDKHSILFLSLSLVRRGAEEHACQENANYYVFNDSKAFKLTGWQPLCLA